MRLDGRHYGELHDYWGGLKDLRKGIIRVLHSLSFVDDPTRLLRAARFEQRFAFKIEKRTLELMENAFEVMKQVSGDRLRHEFSLILQEPRAGAILMRLNQLGVLAAIQPALNDLVVDEGDLPVKVEPHDVEKWSLPIEAAGMPVDLTLNWLVWLGRVQADKVDEVATRLRLPAALKALLIDTIAIGNRQIEIEKAAPSSLVAILDRTPTLAVFAARKFSRSHPFVAQLDRYALKLRHIQPTLDGKDLIRMGLKPSPRIRKTLEGLRAAWLDGKVTNSAEEAQLLNKLLQESDRDDERG